MKWWATWAWHRRAVGFLPFSKSILIEQGETHKQNARGVSVYLGERWALGGPPAPGQTNDGWDSSQVITGLWAKALGSRTIKVTLGDMEISMMKLHLPCDMDTDHTEETATEKSSCAAAILA